MLEKATNGDETVIKTILFPGMAALLVVELIVFGRVKCGCAVCWMLPSVVLIQQMLYRKAQFLRVEEIIPANLFFALLYEQPVS